MIYLFGLFGELVFVFGEVENFSKKDLKDLDRFEIL